MPTREILTHLTALYARDDDPWQHRSSPYEAAKYRATLAAIPPGPFRCGFEIGCGNGTLARLLAPRCERLFVIDCIPAAVASARAALAAFAHVTVLEGAVPQDLPSIRPDLVVLSEVLYFLSPGDIDALARWLAQQGSRVVAVNWTGPTDEPLDGTAAINRLAETLGKAETQHFAGFRIDVFGGQAPRGGSGR